MVLLGLVMELQYILLILLTKLQKTPLLSKLAKLLVGLELEDISEGLDE